ncbi:outer membrane protein assembly factor BamE (lipoprotein component of BamABCDE complex) [Caulobacter rhizosphaerae]|uniref:Outer membrane protein assembly factor BamE (Lipoprotein component of BamABCDE complex) n=1 Tax=Caulobacter rhizosphaerae TaxID=2010972 RepID=A0ABU1N427_9CAUL|nr:outer membrane protein assembly factor BamE [Caulobacter rhizosphaerae]MDR6532830.1 outer membrane protein assembly factor BamE (lipoprotein component of BamABCDE complex) [Caulobacter rhizosphaerae]
MKAKRLALAVLSGLCLAGPAAAVARDTPSPSANTYVASIDPAAFHEVPGERDKLGVTVSPASVRLITPGVDKFSIYPLLGPPHFAESVRRRWNYVLFFPVAPGSVERVRCRMEIRFTRPRGHYNVTVSEVVWQEKSCADRVAAAS